LLSLLLALALVLLHFSRLLEHRGAVLLQQALQLQRAADGGRHSGQTRDAVDGAGGAGQSLVHRPRHDREDADALVAAARDDQLLVRRDADIPQPMGMAAHGHEAVLAVQAPQAYVGVVGAADQGGVRRQQTHGTDAMGVSQEMRRRKGRSLLATTTNTILLLLLLLFRLQRRAEVAIRGVQVLELTLPLLRDTTRSRGSDGGG
jgi:hypothetical protein